jgi:hypothetical protein
MNTGWHRRLTWTIVKFYDFIKEWRKNHSFKVCLTRSHNFNNISVTCKRWNIDLSNILKIIIFASFFSHSYCRYCSYLTIIDLNLNWNSAAIIWSFCKLELKWKAITIILFTKFLLYIVWRATALTAAMICLQRSRFLLD